MSLMETRSIRMRRLRAVVLMGVAGVAVIAAAACGNGGERSVESPALSDCGQRIGVAGESDLVNFSPGAVAEPDAVIELVANCEVGVQVAISGPDFNIRGAIRSKDGAYQAVAVLFSGATGPNGTLTVSQHGRRLGQMTLLSQWVPPRAGPLSFCDPLNPHFHCES